MFQPCRFVSVIVVVIATVAHGLASPAHAQVRPRVACGDIIEVEFTQNNQLFEFTIALEPGDVVSVVVDPFGDTLGYAYNLIEPSGNNIFTQYGSYTTGITTESTSPILSARGDYRFQVANTNIDPSGYTYNVLQLGFGIVTIGFSCTLRDGTFIAAGSTLGNDTPPSNTNAQPAIAPIFSGFGFPGLPPVDFSDVARLPLSPSAAFNGAITPSGGEILGYTLDLSTGQTVDLTITRHSGNLNFGVVVLDAENNVAFQASLIASKSMTTQFIAPNTGTYTFGVFRVDVNPPTQPAATAFSLIVSPVE